MMYFSCTIGTRLYGSCINRYQQLSWEKLQFLKLFFCYFYFMQCKSQSIYNNRFLPNHCNIIKEVQQTQNDVLHTLQQNNVHSPWDCTVVKRREYRQAHIQLHFLCMNVVLPKVGQQNRKYFFMINFYCILSINKSLCLACTTTAVCQVESPKGQRQTILHCLLFLTKRRCLNATILPGQTHLANRAANFSCILLWVFLALFWRSSVYYSPKI